MDEKEIKWSLRAIHDKIDILEYWFNRNRSKTYSKKLDKLFDQAINETARFPDLGKLTDFKNIRVKIVSHYLIFYKIQSKHIEIIRIWDSRRNPGSLDL